jgi:hypothetical protein
MAAEGTESWRWAANTTLIVSALARMPEEVCTSPENVKTLERLDKETEVQKDAIAL